MINLAGTSLLELRTATEHPYPNLETTFPMILTLATFAAFPGVVIAATGRPSRERLMIGAFTSYLAFAIVAGWAAYYLLPAADYTVRQNWTRPPVSSPLGQRHAAALERLSHSAAVSPAVEAARRIEIWRERLTFAAQWLIITAPGLAILTLIAARRPRPRLDAPSTPHL